MRKDEKPLQNKVCMGHGNSVANESFQGILAIVYIVWWSRTCEVIHHLPTRFKSDTLIIVVRQYINIY